MICLLLATSAAAREYQERRFVQELSAEEVLRILIDGDGPIVIDARAPPHYEKGHIPGAINVYSKHVYGWVPDLEKYRNRGILFYCENGLNSQRASNKLLREGFHKVFVMRGNLRRWRALGYPVTAPGSD